ILGGTTYGWRRESYNSVKNAICKRWDTPIFTLRMPCSTLRTSQAALQSTGGRRGVKTLASCCMARVANAVLHAADGRANLQVFRREKSGNGGPGSVCL